MRSKLPHGVQIHDAPAEDPTPALSTKEQQIEWFRSKGLEVIENGDGSFTVKGRPLNGNLS